MLFRSKLSSSFPALLLLTLLFHLVAVARPAGLSWNWAWGRDALRAHVGRGSGTPGARRGRGKPRHLGWGEISGFHSRLPRGVRPRLEGKRTAGPPQQSPGLRGLPSCCGTQHAREFRVSRTPLCLHLPQLSARHPGSRRTASRSQAALCLAAPSIPWVLYGLTCESVSRQLAAPSFMDAKALCTGAS